jgi:hypothetical protein
MRDVKIKSSDFREYLDTMIESGTVETKTVKHGGKGRDGLWVFLLDQSEVGNVATVAKIAKIAKVEQVPSVDTEGKDSSLATLATKDTLPIMATLGGDLLQAEAQRKSKEQHFKTPLGKSKKKVPIRFLADFSGFREGEMVSFEAEADLSVRPGICEILTCSKCPTALRGDKAICDPCKYLGKGKAEA